MRKNKTEKIADRGIRYNVNEAQKSSKRWMFYSLVSSVITMISLIALILLASNTKFFILDEKGAPIELKQLTKLPFTKSRVTSFADEAISRIYGLNFQHYKEQLSSSKLYVGDSYYTKIINEMDRSNYLRALVNKKSVITIIPTPSVYKFNVNSQDSVTVWRSYAKEEISGDKIFREEFTMKINIQRVIPDDIHPWGLVIISTKEESVNNF